MVRRSKIENHSESEKPKDESSRLTLHFARETGVSFEVSGRQAALIAAIAAVAAVVAFGMWMSGGSAGYTLGSGQAQNWSPPNEYVNALTAENERYAYRELAVGEYPCSTRRCFGILVATSTSCSRGFQLQAEEIDQTGANIGLIVGALEYVQKDEPAKVVLPALHLEARDVHVVRAYCES